MSTRLLAAGAVPVGQTAAPEVGRLFYTTSVLHGPTHNPWDLTKAPGGSSGGSGAALSAGLVPLATGSDMGGSIRLPAGWCGVVGVKGTYGRVPRSPGYLGHANMVHYGPLARSVRDCARYLDVTVGVDQRDPYSLPPPAVPYERQIAAPLPSGLRVAVVDDLGMSPSDPEVAAALHNAAAVLIDACGMTQSDGIAWVSFLGMPSNPYYELGRRYLGGHVPSIMTFGVHGGRDAGIGVFNNVKLFKRLLNMGDAKSLITHPASTTHRQLTPHDLELAGITPDMVRLSVGLEHPDDLIEDLDQALSVAASPAA